MPLPAELLSAARRYHNSAAVSLLESYYPVTHRLAYALSGNVETAEQVIRLVIKRALTVLPHWRDENLPDRWFTHHTVLAVRTTQVRPAVMNATTDTLIPSVTSGAYTAFIRVLRALPPQQREVIILHYGEHLNERFMGVAMDCSAEAAAGHFLAANNTIKAMCGDQFESLTKELALHYHALSPAPAAVATLRKQVTRHVWPRLIWRWIYRVATVVILIAIALLVWHYRHLTAMIRE